VPEQNSTGGATVAGVALTTEHQAGARRTVIREMGNWFNPRPRRLPAAFSDLILDSPNGRRWPNSKIAARMMGSHAGSAERPTGNADLMPRRRSRTIETYSEHALTWFFSGMLLIAFIAVLLSQVDFG
jgi:hypothetical protein